MYHQLNHRPSGAMRREVTAHAATIIQTNYIECVIAATATAAATTTAVEGA